MRTKLVINLLTGLMFCQQAIAEGDRHIVEISQFKFVPERLVVTAGDTIVWVNHDIAPHTATSQDHTWGSGTLAENGSWEWVVSTENVGQYYCLFHPTMMGVIELKMAASMANNIRK